LGAISYSLYLAHAPIIVMLMPVYVRIRTASAAAPFLGYVICVGVTFAVALPLSYLTYRFIELPGIKLGKKFYAYFEKRKIASSAHPKSEFDATSPSLSTNGTRP
jgi:peptidoglycan/LPS O-acetylase OafA/YrhL